MGTGGGGAGGDTPGKTLTCATNDPNLVVSGAVSPSATHVECACYESGPSDANTISGAACSDDANQAHCLGCGICYTNPYTCIETGSHLYCGCAFLTKPLQTNQTYVDTCAATTEHPHCCTDPSGQGGDACVCLDSTAMCPPGGVEVPDCSIASLDAKIGTRCMAGFTDVDSCSDYAKYSPGTAPDAMTILNCIAGK